MTFRRRLANRRRHYVRAFEFRGDTSLRAANWRLVGTAGGGSWSCQSRPRVDKHPTEAKQLFETRCAAKRMATVAKTGAKNATVGSLKCAHCKRAMAPKIYPGMPKRFCSPNCRLAAHRKAKEAMRPNEFYTPSYIIEVARACMGGIDLDPASCAHANETVGATAFYSAKDDGLKRPWFGRVRLNPPYGKFWPLFVSRAVTELKAGRIEQAIILFAGQSQTDGQVSGRHDR